MQHAKTNGKTKYIKCETGITRMLQNKRDCFLFIARLEDYSLDEIPEGALFLRSKGYNGFSTGHGATFSQRISASELVINHAANSDDGIQNKTLTFEQLKQQYEYIAWPRGLGTLETAVCRSAFPLLQGSASRSDLLPIGTKCQLRLKGVC